MRALNLNAHIAVTLGRLTDAERLYRLAAERDPMSPGAMTGVVAVLLREGRLAEAEAAVRRALPVASAGLHAALGGILLQLGQPLAALAEIQNDSEERWRLSALPLAYDALGRRADADRALAQLQDKYAQYPYRIAIVYASRGQQDAAFEWLEKSRIAKDFDMLWIKTDPALASLRADPRYAALLGAMALPP